MSVRVMTAVWDAEGLNTSEKMVLLKLADCANDEGRNAYPALATIAKACGLDERSVRRILSELRKRGLLEVEREHDRATHRPATYRLTLPEDNLSPGAGGHDVPRPEVTVSPGRGTPMPPDPSVIRQITISATDRLREIHNALTGLFFVSGRDQEQMILWVQGGVTVEEIEAAYTKTLSWAPENAWAAFRAELGRTVADRHRQAGTLAAADAGLTDEQRAALVEDEAQAARDLEIALAGRTAAAERAKRVRDETLKAARNGQ